MCSRFMDNFLLHFLTLCLSVFTDFFSNDHECVSVMKIINIKIKVLLDVHPISTRKH